MKQSLHVSRPGIRLRLIFILGLATSITLIIQFALYYKMIIDLPVLKWLGFATALSGVLAACVVYALTRPFLGDVERLAEAARQVSTGHFDIRVNARSRGELAALADSFNQMAAEVRRQFDQQKRGEEARRRLIANVSHDLRTPLTATAAMVEALRDDVIQTDSERERYLKTISSELAYMSRLIRDLTDLLQLESGQIRLNCAPVNLEDLLTEVLEGFGAEMEHREATFEVEVGRSDAMVSGDATRLRQALTNVIQNAVSYTPVGGRVRVRLYDAAAVGENSDEGPAAVRIEVVDEGPGVSPTDAERIFERFYRADPARGRGKDGEHGMGLGLAIARDIVGAHQGRIGVDPSHPNGALLWIEIPGVAARSDESAIRYRRRAL